MWGILINFKLEIVFYITSYVRGVCNSAFTAIFVDTNACIYLIGAIFIIIIVYVIWTVRLLLYFITMRLRFEDVAKPLSTWQDQYLNVGTFWFAHYVALWIISIMCVACDCVLYKPYLATCSSRSFTYF